MDDIYDGYWSDEPTKEEKIRKIRKKKIKRLGAMFILNKIIEGIKRND